MEAVLLYDFGLSRELEHRVSVGVEPVERVAHIRVEREANLVYDNVDSILDLHGLRHILAASLLTHLQIDQFITQILTETHVNDVSCEDLTELSRHIEVVSLGWRSSCFGGPFGKSVCRLVFEGLKHMHKALFVKSMGTGLTLLLPMFIVVGE